MEQSVQQAQEEVIGLGEDWRLVEALLPDRWMEMARVLGDLAYARSAVPLRRAQSAAGRRYWPMAGLALSAGGATAQEEVAAEAGT